MATVAYLLLSAAWFFIGRHIGGKDRLEQIKRLESRIGCQRTNLRLLCTAHNRVLDVTAVAIDSLIRLMLKETK